jgi:dihydroxyacid dehydratase/phosphogluconate dehydratase
MHPDYNTGQIWGIGGMSTANTMSLAIEAIGMSIPYSSIMYSID